MEVHRILPAGEESEAEGGEGAHAAREQQAHYLGGYSRRRWIFASASLGIAVAVAVAVGLWAQGRGVGRADQFDITTLAQVPLTEPELYASQSKGLGTWYDPAKWGGGTCGYDYEWQPPGVAGTVALNFKDFDAGGKMHGCGMCVKVWAKGNYAWNGHSGGGSLPMHWNGDIFFVTNSCPSCPNKGDIDFALKPGQGTNPGQSGNGQWEITWQGVPCPKDTHGGKGAIYMLDSEDNQYWVKPRPMNLYYPVVGMDFFEHGKWTHGAIHDQFGFSWNPSHGAAPSPLKVRMTSATGEVLHDELPKLTRWVEGNLHATDKLLPHHR